ncbi:MAG: preprotein translocase subunit SecY, partial [Candidatus Kapabacteria bacterium]|nr:preprotein translocase subunit SecY [Candidatus Kapabacteria bacterium]MDW7997507.1 preprotein translocase subunit SecY [Bacteroidota bacterium]
MARFLETLKNIWRIEELRQRILFTLGVLVAVRIGSHITLPGIDVYALEQVSGLGMDNTLFG